jgi:hypothetical protein
MRHGSAVPTPQNADELAEVKSALPAGATASRVGGWVLFKYGRDPGLTYSVSENRGRWLFVPADGREEQTIVLSR